MKQLPISILSAKSLYIQLRFGEQVISSATAFLVQTSNGAALITNRHNVTGRHQQTGTLLSKTGGVPDNLLVHLPRPVVPGTVTQAIALLKDEQPCWLEHPTLGQRADFVLIPVAPVQIPLHCYKLGPTGEPFNTRADKSFKLNDGDVPLKILPADRVSVIGYPFGLRIAGQLPVWANGFVASEPNIDYDGLPVFLIDCRSRQGQSGAPVVAVVNSGMVALENSDMAQAMFTGPVSRFLGIYSGRISNESDLGYVWKASAIKELVAAYEVLSKNES